MRDFWLASAATAAAIIMAAPAAAQPGSEVLRAQGSLGADDAQDSDQQRYDEHRLRLEAGTRYRIGAESDAFDTFIELYRAGESEPVAMDDDGGEELNSRLIYAPQESAEYILRVRAFSGEGEGDYVAYAELLPPLPPPNSQPADVTADLRWNLWEGELTADDPERDGAYFDDYLVPMRAGEVRYISIESAEFDPVLWVLRADAREGEPIDIDDDSGPWLHALLGFSPEDDGDHLVRVTAYGTGNTGRYRLRVSDPVTPPPLVGSYESTAESFD